MSCVGRANSPANEAREDGELIASTGVRQRWARTRSIAVIQCSIGTIVITDANGQALTSRRPLAAICRAPRQWLVSAFHRPTGAGHGKAYKENLGEAEHQPRYSELEKMGERARSRQGEMAGAAGVAVKSSRLGGGSARRNYGDTLPVVWSPNFNCFIARPSPPIWALVSASTAGGRRDVRPSARPARASGQQIASRAITAALGTNSRRNSNRFAPKELYSAPAVDDG
jgi:hypothetical protein